MKMYLGSYIDVFSATYVTLMTFFSTLFAIVILMNETSIVTVCITVFCIGISLLFGYMFFKSCNQFLSWGVFDEKGILVKTVFKKPYFIEYSKCKDVGIGFYMQTMRHTGAGNKVRYIYLSYDVLKKKERSNINLVKNKEGFVKLRRSSKAYQYLIDTMPTKQKTLLYYANENDDKGWFYVPKR